MRFNREQEVLESVFVEMDPILHGFRGVLVELVGVEEGYLLPETAAGTGMPATSTSIFALFGRVAAFWRARALLGAPSPRTLGARAKVQVSATVPASVGSQRRPLLILIIALSLSRSSGPVEQLRCQGQMDTRTRFE